MEPSELDKKNIPKAGLRLKQDFSLTEFGGELDRYLESYEAIKEILSEVEPMIPQERKDALPKLSILYLAAATEHKDAGGTKSTLHLSGKLRHDFMDPRKSINGCLCQKH